MENNTTSISNFFKHYSIKLTHQVEGKPGPVRIGLNHILFTSLESGY